MILRKPEVADALGALLLALYQAAQSHDAGRFRATALTTLQQYIPFDGAHWSLAAGREIYGAHLIGMPADSASWFNRADPGHAVARECLSRPGQAVRFDTETLTDTPVGRELAHWLDARFVMVTTGDRGPARLWHLLGRVRRGPTARPFDAADQAMLQRLTPHLAVLLQINAFAALARTRAATSADRLPMGLADSRGILHAVEPQFESWLAQEWPGWRGPALPAALCEVLEQGGGQYAGEHLQARLEREHERVLVMLAQRSPAERLTPRERAAAEAYAEGRSHKEVARVMGLSPVTVRGYLRAAYEKLGVNDKAQLARQRAGAQDQAGTSSTR